MFNKTTFSVNRISEKSLGSFFKLNYFLGESLFWWCISGYSHYDCDDPFDDGKYPDIDIYLQIWFKVNKIDKSAGQKNCSLTIIDIDSYYR